MALHFVSTSVLSSTDGIAFEKEEKKDSEETRLAKASAIAAANKPLFEQLAELKAKKQEEYDANTKLIFAPPRALDEEDEQFFHSLQETQSKRKELREQTEKQELATFREAVHQKSSAETTKFKIAQKESSTKTAAAAPVITRKRKVASVSGAGAESRKEQKVFSAAVGGDIIINEIGTNAGTGMDAAGEAIVAAAAPPLEGAEINTTANNIQSLMAAYGSDDEDD